MAQAEDDLRQVLYALEAELDHLDDQMKASLSEWTGAAQQAYEQAHAQWRAAAGDMTRVLGWLHGVLTTAHANYSSARAVNVGMWRGNG